MNPATSEAIRRSRAEQSARFAAQTITIDDHWRIVRADAMNWEVQQRVHGAWQREGFYGRLTAAFGGLAGKALGEEAAGTVVDILRILEDIRRRITAALDRVG